MVCHTRLFDSHSTSQCV